MSASSRDDTQNAHAKWLQFKKNIGKKYHTRTILVGQLHANHRKWYLQFELPEKNKNGASNLD